MRGEPCTCTTTRPFTDIPAVLPVTETLERLPWSTGEIAVMPVPASCMVRSTSTHGSDWRGRPTTALPRDAVNRTSAPSRWIE